MGGYRLNAQSLSRVMTGEHQVQTAFHGIEVGVVRALAGDVCIQSGSARLLNHVARTAGDETDPARLLRPTWNQHRAALECVEHTVELQGNRLSSGQAGRSVSPHTHRYA